MELNKDADNHLADNVAVLREPYDWRGRVYKHVQGLPAMFVWFRVLEIGAKALKLDFKLTRDYSSVLLGAFGGLVVYELVVFLIHKFRRHRPGREVLEPIEGGDGVGLTPAQDSVAKRFKVAMPFEGRLPLSFLIQAFVACAFVETVLVLFWCWVSNLFPGIDIPYLYAFAYAWPVALIGFYGKRADRYLEASYKWNKDAFWDRSGKPREVVEWSELRKTSIVTTVCTVIAYCSLLNAFVEERTEWAWGVVFAFIMLVFFSAAFFLWSGFGKREPKRDEPTNE